MHFHNHFETVKESYRELRKTAFQETLKNAEIPSVEKASTCLRDIDDFALEECESWPPDPRLKGQSWDWRKFVRKSRASAFQLAIWFDKTLCGLAIGRLSSKKLYLRLQYIQGHPGGHPLEGYIVALTLMAAEYYAAANNAQYLTIEKPVDELVKYYLEFPGFHEAKPECKRASKRLTKKLKK